MLCWIRNICVCDFNSLRPTYLRKRSIKIVFFAKIKIKLNHHNNYAFTFKNQEYTDYRNIQIIEPIMIILS
jgi:hypothetical protein